MSVRSDPVGPSRSFWVLWIAPGLVRLRFLWYLLDHFKKKQNVPAGSFEKSVAMRTSMASVDTSTHHVHLLAQILVLFVFSGGTLLVLFRKVHLVLK